ncbi:MAG: hypothetical protein V4489_00640 [Chlamydiota bacterium]
MSESIANNTSSFPSVCSYIPPQPSMNEETVIYEQTDLFNSAEVEDTRSKKRAAKTSLDKTPQEARAEVLASMHATLLKNISNTCVNMINTHRERLKRQYKMQREEMEAIQNG